MMAALASARRRPCGNASLGRGMTTGIERSPAGTSSAVPGLAVAGLPALAGAASVALALLPQASLRALLARISAGALETLVPVEETRALQARLLVAGVVLLGVAGLSCARRLRIPERITGSLAALGRLLADAARVVRRFAREEPAHATVLLALTAWCLAQGLATLRQPIREDEAINSILFLRRSPLYILATYQNNNNHILHTLLARLSTLIFGHEPWAQRLPALAAGVLLVPAGYAAARALVSRSAALIAAACIASWPYLVDLSTNARGYTLLLLVFLILLALLPRLARGKDLGAWTAFVLLGAIGFYTTPLMGLLFGVVLVWLGLSALVELPRREWLAQGMRLAGACAAIGGLALLCYAPPIVLEGPRVAFLQSWMLPQLPSTESDGGPLTDPTTYGGVLDELIGRMRLLWSFWTLGQPALVSWIALAAFGLAIVGARRHPRGFRLIASAALALLAFVLVFSKTPLHWQLPHLLLVYLIGVAAGAALLLERLAGADRSLAFRLPLALALALALGNGVFVWFGMRNRQHELPWYLGYYDAPEAAGYLRRVLRGDDHVVGLKMELFALAYYSPVDPPFEKRFFPRNYSRGAQELEALRGRPLDLFVIETDQSLPLRERFLTMVIEAGFAPTDDVERLGTSRVVRYSRSSEASVTAGGDG
jgi:hypothetical protein